MANQIQVLGQVTGRGSIIQVSDTISYGNPIGTILNVPLVSGDNLFDVPAGTTSIFITPDPANTIQITLLGDASDTTGLPIAVNIACGPINVSSGALTINLRAASAIALLTKIQFI